MFTALLIYTGLIIWAIIGVFLSLPENDLEIVEVFPKRVLILFPTQKEVQAYLINYTEIFRQDSGVTINRSSATIRFDNQVFYVRAATNDNHLRGYRLDEVYVFNSHEIENYKDIKNHYLIPALFTSGGKIVEL